MSALIDEIYSSEESFSCPNVTSGGDLINVWLSSKHLNSYKLCVLTYLQLFISPFLDMFLDWMDRNKVVVHGPNPPLRLWKSRVFTYSLGPLSWWGTIHASIHSHTIYKLYILLFL